MYRAYDSRLDREVAIKVVPADLPTIPSASDVSNKRRARVARLSHPNILTLHDFGRTSGISYAVMELLDGETLRARLAAGALPPRKAADIGAQTARGLAAAHDKHIVHRDLKPENLFISGDGQVRILDFGLARRNDPIATDPRSVDSPTMAIATQPGVVLGTVGYMAPEQVKGEAVDHRTDILALGCVAVRVSQAAARSFGESAPEDLDRDLEEDPADPAASASPSLRPAPDSPPRLSREAPRRAIPVCSRPRVCPRVGARGSPLVGFRFWFRCVDSPAEARSVRASLAPASSLARWPVHDSSVRTAPGRSPAFYRRFGS